MTGSTDTVTWPIAILRIVVLNVKMFGVILFFMMARWSWPRFRFDQLMALAWKVMLPLGLVNLLAMACLAEYQQALASAFGGNGVVVLCAINWGVMVIALVVAGMASPLLRRDDNRPRGSLSAQGSFSVSDEAAR